MTNKKKELQFEEAFARLEKILETMNSGTIALEESLKLYEEADELIGSCQSKLSQAEKKIEMLVKNRQGELVRDEDGNPHTQELPDFEQ